MSPFPDTSFLCALYREQDNSKRADRIFASLSEPLAISSLALLEFRQSIRFQMGLHVRDKTKGFSSSEGRQMLADLKSDLATGAIEIASVEWIAVHSIAERLSDQYTLAHGHRFADILHVATALSLEAKEFITFDANQRKLAKAENLKVLV